MPTQAQRPMSHIYNRGPIRAVVGAFTKSADAFADAVAEVIPIDGHPRVGALDDTIASSKGAHVLYTGAFGLLSYTLYAGKWIVAKHHPVLGTIAALFALSNLATVIAADTVHKAA